VKLFEYIITKILSLKYLYKSFTLLSGYKHLLDTITMYWSFQEDEDDVPSVKKPKKSSSDTSTGGYIPLAALGSDQMEEDKNDATAAAAKPETANDVAGEERGGAGGRGNAEYTAFVSNLPFNITVEDLREKFKHVRGCICMYSMLPIPLCDTVLDVVHHISHLCDVFSTLCVTYSGTCIMWTP